MFSSRTPDDCKPLHLTAIRRSRENRPDDRTGLQSRRFQMGVATEQCANRRPTWLNQKRLLRVRGMYRGSR